MFSKNKKSNTQQAATPRSVPSIISADLKIVGDLQSAGEVQVDGEISGDINAKVLLVGESATIKGEILADTVRVHGHVNGQIKAKFVNLAKSAHVIGDILHENLSIQEGAFLEGHITHMSEADVKAMDDASQRTASQGASQGASAAGKPAEASRPAEDRVNLVVKAGGSKPAQPPAPQGGGMPGQPSPKAASNS